MVRPKLGSDRIRFVAFRGIPQRRQAIQADNRARRRSFHRLGFTDQSCGALPEARSARRMTLRRR